MATLLITGATGYLGSRIVLDALSHLLLGVVAALIAWRTAVSAISINEAGETSMILAWPVWMVVAAIVPSFVLLAAAGFYNTVIHWKSASSGESA
jgi:nucleoside-diphosphate-sugar epimerase